MSENSNKREKLVDGILGICIVMFGLLTFVIILWALVGGVRTLMALF